MQERGGNFLRHIEGLLKAGKGQEARPLLAEYLKRFPNSARGWWLLSLLLTDEKQQVDCLERVLRLDPDSALAQTRLAKLKGTSDYPPDPEPISLLASTRNKTAFEVPVEEPELAPLDTPLYPETDSSLRPFSISTDSEPVHQASVPRKPLPLRKKKPAVLPMAILLGVFCAAMGTVGFVAIIVLNQSASPVQIPTPLLLTPLVMTQGTTSSSGWELPATWTPTTTVTSLPSRTPLPSDTPLPSTPTSMYTLTKTSIPSYAIGPARGLFAPDFTLKNVSDVQVSLSDYAGRPVILLFWATWCPYCEREMSSLQAIYEDYKDSGLSVLAINCGDPAGQVRTYKRAHDLTFTVLLDTKSKTIKLYQASSFPTHFFIDSSGRITYIVVGMMDYAGLKNQVNVITRGQP